MAQQTPDRPQETGKGPKTTQKSYVRQDLWKAIVDYVSGTRYVWDEAKGIARPAPADEALPTFPTLTKQIAEEWREAFVRGHLAEFSPSEQQVLNKWRTHRLRTDALSTTTRQLWNAELTLRVKQRVDQFFSSQKQDLAFHRQYSDTIEEEIDTATVDSEPVDTPYSDQIAVARDAGDFFSVGELLIRSLEDAKPQIQPRILGKAIIAWATTQGPLFEPSSLSEVSEKIDNFTKENLATSFVNALYRLRKASLKVPEDIGDLSYRLRESIITVYDLDDRRTPAETCAAAVAKLETKLTEFEGAVQRFSRTTPATAKVASIDITKLSHAIQPLLVTAERDFLRDLETLIGPAFKKLCQAYERNDDVEVLRRAPELLENVGSHSAVSGDARLLSGLWNEFVDPIIKQVSTLMDVAMTRGEAALAPSLKLRNSATKADLRDSRKDITLSFTLHNSGRGHAYDVSLQGQNDPRLPRILVVDPTGPFGIAPGSERLLRVRLFLSSPFTEASIPVAWICGTQSGKQARYEETITVTQQSTDPSWELLLSDPPYSVKPIRAPERLFGRDTVLQSLILAAMVGASKFIWGQKRIGKTSLLQVLKTSLDGAPHAKCLLFRMGQLAPLHEGQIAHLIATEFIKRLGSEGVAPAESEFGAGMGRLVPFIELLVSSNPNAKFVVIIDEFDDLDSAFYTGERGKQFFKALRSLSEIGLTFFFAGSERMEAIYQRHQADLNRWTNVHLDRLADKGDCTSLITTPAADAIEFSSEAIEIIINYAKGNPFYMQYFCYQIFERCLQERRTFVDANDTDAARHQLLRVLGRTNFSHFWEDNPTLDAEEQLRAKAENCVALACMSVLGGSFEDVEELLSAQESFHLTSADEATAYDLRNGYERLLSRNVIRYDHEIQKYFIVLPLLREWLAENAIAELLPLWTQYNHARRAESGTTKTQLPSTSAQESIGFIIAEDDLIAIAQKLVYCGRQKDVAEIRSWLRQFDDEPRIEIAFQLLKRLAEKGFVNEGNRSLALKRLDDMVRVRRQQVGEKAWKIERGRYDNLCLAYVDSPLKSGADTTRDLRNMMRPGKSGAANEIGVWMERHVGDDPMVVILDEFAGTGESLVKGVSQFRTTVGTSIWQQYTNEGRISVFIMFAFADAVQNIQHRHPDVHVVAANIFGDELRACAEEAEIFDDESDRRFARDILLQLGRELYPDAPLGYGDLGSLVAFYNTIPNNTLPIFWSNGRVRERQWIPIFPRP